MLNHNDTKKEYDVDEDLVKMDEWQLTSLARLEKHILDYYVSQGYVVGSGDWNFQVSLSLEYKEKCIHIFFNGKSILHVREEKMEDVFSRVYECFEIKE